MAGHATGVIGACEVQTATTAQHALSASQCCSGVRRCACPGQAAGRSPACPAGAGAPERVLERWVSDALQVGQDVGLLRLQGGKRMCVCASVRGEEGRPGGSWGACMSVLGGWAEVGWRVWGVGPIQQEQAPHIQRSVPARNPSWSCLRPPRSGRGTPRAAGPGPAPGLPGGTCRARRRRPRA